MTLRTFPILLSTMRPSWKKRVAEVWPYATTVTTVMFTVCAVGGVFIAWQSGAKTLFGYIVALVDPSVAGIAMLAVCAVFPDVFLGSRYRLPHVLSLPTLYLVLIFGIKAVSQSAAFALRRFEDTDRYDLIWLQPPVLIEAWIALVVVLSSIGAFSKNQPDVK